MTCHDAQFHIVSRSFSDVSIPTMGKLDKLGWGAGETSSPSFPYWTHWVASPPSAPVASTHVPEGTTRRCRSRVSSHGKTDVFFSWHNKCAEWAKGRWTRIEHLTAGCAVLTDQTLLSERSASGWIPLNLEQLVVFAFRSGCFFSWHLHSTGGGSYPVKYHLSTERRVSPINYCEISSPYILVDLFISTMH